MEFIRRSMKMPVVATVAGSPGGGAAPVSPNRYELQKRRDWLTFGQYLRNHQPPLELSRCSGAHVLEFLRYLDQFGKTKVHSPACPFFGHPSPPAPCPCPLKQAWGSLDALIGRLRAAFEEHGGMPKANPFGARAVRLYLREVRDSQAKARGITYKKRRLRHPPAHKQAMLQKDHHHHALVEVADVPVTALAERRRDVPKLAPHILIPQDHFVHGHFLAPIAGDADTGRMPAVGVTGEDMVLATAEAHTAGCMMPLSVFH